MGAMLNQKTKNKKLKIGGGGTVTAALPRRPYPPPFVWKVGIEVVHRVLFIVIHSCLWIT
jgi:hypothetical protein